MSVNHHQMDDSHLLISLYETDIAGLRCPVHIDVMTFPDCSLCLLIPLQHTVLATVSVGRNVQFMRLLTWNTAYICLSKFLQLLLSFLVFWLVDKLWQPCWVKYESNGVYIERGFVQSNSLSRNNGHKGLRALSRGGGGGESLPCDYPTHFTRPQQNKVKVNIITRLCVRNGARAIIVTIALCDYSHYCECDKHCETMNFYLWGCPSRFIS
jgi:hypothetical protein